MHRVILKAKESVCVKCSSCRESLEIQANKHNHPVTMAFTHPKQCIPTTCVHCTKDFAWSPEDLIPRAIKFEAAPALG